MACELLQDVTGLPVHIVQHGRDLRPLFGGNVDYRRYLRALLESAEEVGCHIHAYALMKHHVHLLVTSSTPGGVERLVQGIVKRFVGGFSEAHGGPAPLLARRYKARLIADNTSLLACMRHIELNPVRADLVSDPGEYRWSSYRWNALGSVIDPYVSAHPAYRALGSSGEARRKLYRSMFRTELDLPPTSCFGTAGDERSSAGRL